MYFSAARVWEIAIKSALGKIKFHYSAKEIADGAEITGFIALPISSGHVAGVAHLPMIHSDPFDRLLIAQALAIPARSGFEKILSIHCIENISYFSHSQVRTHPDQ